MFQSRDHVKKFVDCLNTKHPNTHFTFEIEDQNSFSFLDIKIIRNTEKKAFERSVYRKSTFSGVFTNFKSFIPMTYKIGLLETMLFRCFSICSSYGKFHEEIVKLKETFKRNSYPEEFIDRCIKNFLNKLPVPKVVELTAARKELILVLPCLGQQSFEIRNRIQCCVKKNAPVFNVKVVFQSKIKDKNNKMLHSDLVYKFNCNICNDICYGKTKSHFKVRACEHLGITPLTGKKVKNHKRKCSI